MTAQESILRSMADGNGALIHSERLAIAAVLDRVTLLERLLVPFARYAFDGRYLDTDQLRTVSDGSIARSNAPTVGDCRAAAREVRG